VADWSSSVSVWETFSSSPFLSDQLRLSASSTAKKPNTVAIKKDSQLSILAPYPTCLLLFKQSQQLVFMNYPRQLRCNESQMFRETVDDTSIKPRVRSY